MYSAMRYAMGRMTYITGCWVRFAKDYGGYLTNSCLLNMINELEQAIEKHEKDVEDDQTVKRLGMHCDYVAWKQTLEILKKHHGDFNV